MFMKKIVDMASKKPARSLNGLKEDDVNPRLVFHYGIASGSISMAYDSIQNILAIATLDGRIKLYGKDNTQAHLESNEAAPSKFLQFLENQGVLLNVTAQNHIEVWDIDRKQLSHVYIFKEEITSFMIMRRSFYIYIGDSLGNISILKLHREPYLLICMQYCIPFSASNGATTEAAEDTAVMYTLPQPMAESRRVLIIFGDGLIVLWGIQESKVMFTTGGKMLHSLVHEPRKVTSACWACPYGSKVVVGYSNGEIFLWSIPGTLNSKNAAATDKEELCAAQNVPLCKLNLGYKMEKAPIVSLKWVPGDGRASRLYVNGASGSGSSNSFQIIMLNEYTESRTIKLVLPLAEACLDMEIVSSGNDRTKNKQDALLLLLKSGLLCVYDDSEIQKYLIQCLSKSPPTLPKQLTVKVPFGDSRITVAKFVTDNSDQSISMDKDEVPAKNFPSLFSVDSKDKAVNRMNSAHLSGFTKVKNLYITGHSNGVINFWDASCPLLFLILSVKQQSEDSHSLSGIPVTALYFDSTSRLLVSGDQSGMVRIFKLKPEQFNTGNIISSLQAAAKQGFSSIIHDVKLVKISGTILSICINPGTGNLVIGSDEGYVSIVDMEKQTILSQRRFTSELYTALKDSSVLALEGDTGNALSSSMVRSKKPSKALFMQILDAQDTSVLGSHISVKDTIPKQSLLLLCSEKDVRLYSLAHVIQGTKKVYSKKKLHSTCCWASTFHSPCSDVGLLLLFTNGKIEIRSLPDLTLLKETSLRGFTFPSSNSEISLSSSSEGELLVVNADQEIFFVSSLSRKDIYRHLEFLSHVFDKDAIPIQEGPTSVPTIHKEKKKGIFSNVIRDIKGNKAKQGEATEAGESQASIEEELSAIFSTSNFSLDVEKRDGSPILDEDDVELNIDDIDLEEEPTEKPKGQKIITLNKKKLNSGLQALKGKLISKKVKSASMPVKEEMEDVKNVDAIDQIKKRYGFPSSSEISAAKTAESKLHDNLGKLQKMLLQPIYLLSFTVNCLRSVTKKSYGEVANVPTGEILLHW
ncbi:hypothetical protein MRB53_034183 [Persea americana]|uniref:Uncharacterized protein n=1 Tax=Persea americana TaxID=3435 RepID=A0ACC2KX10_PERAE|nr:hypothetical protein MRB53_034183 [Persea americana]